MARTQSGGLELTDRGMQGRPDPTVDRWFRHSFGRGAGVFEGRITTGGARLFYFRYTAPDGSRTRRLIGSYSPKGEGPAQPWLTHAAPQRSGPRSIRPEPATWTPTSTGSSNRNACNRKL